MTHRARPCLHRFRLVLELAEATIDESAGNHCNSSLDKTIALWQASELEIALLLAVTSRQSRFATLGGYL